MPTTADHAHTDLWGPPFGEERVDSEPLVDLKKQAAALTERTQGRIVGDAHETIRGDTVWIGLWAKVPTLGNYEYKLITLAHPLDIPDPRHPFPLGATDHLGASRKIEDPGQWRAWLGDVLASTTVHALIGRLLGFSRQHEAE